MQGPALALSNDSDNISNPSAISTDSEQAGVSEFSHLIEVYFEDDNYLVASESIVYSASSANNSQELVLWIPENAEIMQFQVTDMIASTTATSVNYSRTGDFVSFPSYGDTSSSGMPLLYGIRYVVQSHEEEQTFRKVISEDGIFDYPVSRLIIIVHHEESEIPAITSVSGLQLVADEVISEMNYTSYAWSSPQFNEFSITLINQNSGTKTGMWDNYSLIVGIVLLIIVVAAALFYKKNDSGSISDLEDLYEAELAVLAQIKEDRKKKKLSEEEFENLHKKHSDSALKIKNKMEKLKKT
ncbi:hypothetical protein RE476_02230 [Methanolobus mangrovi]|uniref:Uncharacterized protein n=1 Tax=Methanolobus mangrovi TaxID=3072977 RepID=A0AA51UGB3_9EURY|nr:hypothetical protein [Methanolobus mangrovi]WMW22656.1 hypothetical protein RE476_02230 [Methanolobus mangrovi]